MREGKLARPIYERSVMRPLKSVFKSAGDVMSLPYGGLCVTAVSSYTINSKNAVWFCINAALGKLAVMGAAATTVSIAVFLPPEFAEDDLKEMMCAVSRTCTHLHIDITDIDIEVTVSVVNPVITVTAYGSVHPDRLIRKGGAMPGQDIVVTKSIGLEGVALLAEKYEAELLKRYTESFIYKAQSFTDYASILREAAAAISHGTTAMQIMGQGGVLAALRNFADESKVGITVELKDIPIKQETVEICEFFGCNPYQLMSTGSLIVAVNDGFGLVRKLAKEGICAAVIGKVTDSNDKIILRDDETRYLDLPGMDEIFNIRKE